MSSTNFSPITALAERALSGALDREDALKIATAPEHELPALFADADALRRRKFGNRVQLCSIINAKSGLCEQDCAFCAQSSHHDASIDTYGFVQVDQIVQAAEVSRESGAAWFSIVTSGGSLGGEDLDKALLGVRAIAGLKGLRACASLGVLDERAIDRLREAGLSRFHHNLETARSHYPSICSTREYDENVKTVRAAKKAGLSVCCGGIFGMGESAAQRVELAFELKSLGVDCAPLNFLHPILGTPVSDCKELTPLDCLRIIALFRCVLPEAQVLVCGGREVNLGQLQPLMFYAGASGLMIGNYLTTTGRDPAADLQMIQQLGMVPAGSEW